MGTRLQTLKERLVEIPLSSPAYPRAWKDLKDAPERLYAFGNISLLQKRIFAVVGSRRTPQNALKLGADIAEKLSGAFVLLTGTAEGGDSAGIEGALKGSGEVICLLAGGFSAMPQMQLPLLRKVAKKGLILSPHPFETPVRSFSYEYRNKLLAKLCEGLLVLGAGEKSGALITAKYAVQFEKPVFAFPYPPNSFSGAGCNGLIKAGARLTERAEDIAAVYGVRLQEKKQVSLNEEEERVYTLLRERESAHISELAEGTGVPTYKIRSVLSSLEIKGVVLPLGGNYYSIV